MTLGNISDNIVIKEYFKDFMFHISITNFHTAKLDASIKIKLPISFVDIPYSFIIRSLLSLSVVHSIIFINFALKLRV